LRLCSHLRSHLRAAPLLRRAYYSPAPTEAQRLQRRITEEIEAARDPVTGKPANIIQPTEEQAPGLRSRLVGVLQAAGPEGVKVSRFWEHYRKLYSGDEQPRYVKSKPLTGSKRKQEGLDQLYTLSEIKPDRTIVAMLRAYGTTLTALLSSIPYVEVRTGGRQGMVLVLKPEFLTMLKVDDGSHEDGETPRQGLDDEQHGHSAPGRGRAGQHGELRTPSAPRRELHRRGVEDYDPPGPAGESTR